MDIDEYTIMYSIVFIIYSNNTIINVKYPIAIAILFFLVLVTGNYLLCDDLIELRLTHIDRENQAFNPTAELLEREN